MDEPNSIGIGPIKITPPYWMLADDKAGDRVNSIMPMNIKTTPINTRSGLMRCVG